MTTKHTPGPWVWHEQGEANEYCLLASGQKWVIAFRQNGELMPERQRANAAFIVRACNSHDDLLAALVGAEAFMSGIPDTSDLYPREWLKVVRAAITRAKGE